MNNRIIKWMVCPLLLCQIQAVSAQGRLEDYRRAYGLYDKFKADQVFQNPEQISWSNDSTFHYTVYTAEGTDYCIGRVNGQQIADATVSTVNKKAVAALISKETGKQTDASKLRLDRFGVTRDNAGRISFNYDGFSWVVDNACGTQPTLVSKEALKPVHRGKQRHWMEVDDEKGNRPVVSPDGKMQAYIKNDNVYVSQIDGSGERALSNDGTPGNYYSSWIKWSPDGQYVASTRIRPAEKRYVYYVESSPKSQLQPILHKQEYAKPGDELRFKVPCAFNVRTGKAVIPSTELFDHQYDLYGPDWSEDSKSLTFIYNERGHKIYRMLELNVETGLVRTLAEESSSTFVNYNRTFCHILKGGKQMIWMSERDNWAHLYMYDMKKGRVDHQITKGEWVVRRVLRVDEDNKVIFFTASGVNPDEDPYQVHYYKIGFNGKNMVCLTPEDGDHSATFNADYTMLIDKYSKVDQAPVTLLRSTTGDNRSKMLAKADLSRLTQAGWRAPEIFTAPGRDGKTMMWGIIQRPTNFDPNKKYPVIEYIYSGPGDAYTPKSFLSYNWNMTALAELGFIVVQLDAMGTSYRGKKFEDVCYKNLKDAGFPDRIAWIKAAAAKYPYMDADRVGIFGASAGGQESLTAVLNHPEFYKAAYSSCGCHDNRMDKIWWNEQWMGYPVDSSYVECSNVENAHKLTRPLMIVVGELDDNVDPASTMQVVNALIKANKDFELVVLPGLGHTMGGTYGEHKRYDFFVKELMGIDPPKWEDLEKK